MKDTISASILLLSPTLKSTRVRTSDISILTLIINYTSFHIQELKINTSDVIT